MRLSGVLVGVCAVLAQYGLAQTVVVTTPKATPAVPEPGEPVLFEVTVTMQGGTPIGVVRFYHSSLLYLGFSSVTNGRASFTAPGFPAGVHNILAEYDHGPGGQTTFSPALRLTVGRTATSLASLTVEGSARFGDPMTFRSSISPAISGQVSWFDGEALLATNTIGLGGQVSYTTSALGAGPHAISVRYAGAATNLASQSPTHHVSIRARPALTMTMTPNPAPAAANIAMTVTAARPSAASLAPTGNVTWLAGSATIGTAALQAGTATLSAPASQLGVGTHTITASYSGDVYYDAASLASPLSVAGRPTSTSLSVRLADTITLRALVTGLVNVIRCGDNRCDPLSENIAAGANAILLGLQPRDFCLSFIVRMGWESRYRMQPLYR